MGYNADMADNGIIRDDRGRFVKGTAKHTITQADASTLARKRWQKARLAAADRVTREAASIDPSVTTWADAWGLVTARQYSALMDSDKPRGDDLLAIGKAIGAMPSDVDRLHAAQAATQPRTQPEVVLALLALVGDMQSANIIDIISNDDVIDADDAGGGGGGTGG